MPSNKEIFFKAVFLEPPRICGKRLLPFSLAHTYFLSYLKNPYIVGGQVTDDDLLSAIFICSLTYSEIKKYLNYPRWFAFSVWVLKWKFRKLDIAHESFRTYLSEYFDVPDHFVPVPNADEEQPPVKEDERTSYSAPWQYHLVHILCREYRFTLDEAWNTGITVARCYYDVWSESTGFDNSLVSVDIGQPLLEKTNG